MSHRRWVVAGLLVLAVLLPGATASAALWTPLASNTSSDIRNVEYQSATRMWFVTAGGDIFTRQGDGSFQRRLTAPGVVFNDIEFQKPPGTIGLAVGNGGKVFRSVDSGANWTPVTGITVSRNKANSSVDDCTANDPLGDINAVRFAGNGRAWIMAEGSQLARSQPASAADVGASNPAGAWADANVSGSSCKIDSNDDTGQGDAFFVPGNPDVAYFCNAYFGAVFLTTDNLAGTASRKGADCGNGVVAARRLAGDQSNPNRMWAVAPGGPSGSYTAVTQDGWASSDSFKLLDEDGYFNQTPYDVAAAGGTVIAAGDAGMILVSTDGVNFRHQPAGGAQRTAGWRAVSLASPTDAVVGGQYGALAISSDANVPSSPPIAAPAPSFAQGPGPTTAAAPLSPVAGSQPRTTTTGGTVITIYRLVRVTGHSGRYVPVRVRARGRRTVRIALYPKGKTRAISTQKVSFRAKGVRLAKVRLPATARLGRYTVVVKVYKGRVRTGRTVRQAIVVA